MLRGVGLPASADLTPRARSFAYPVFTAAGQKLLDDAKAATPALIDAEDLKAAAQARVVLSDFGDAPLDEPLQALCTSMNEEIELHALGRTYARQQLLGLLSTRLRLVDLWKRHPEILDIPIERPIIIIGLPRSGTTILHKLLGRDPMRRMSPFWEQIMPLPINAADEPDQRPAAAQSSLDSLYTLAPEFASMHEMSVDEPDEDITQLMFGFASKQFEWSYVVPSYVATYRAMDHSVGYQWFRRVLQTSLWLRPRPARWILKAPQHLEQMGPLTDAFPDAILVQTHRDPSDAVVSLASMTCYGQRRYFDHPNPHLVGANMAEIIERLLRGGEAARAGLKQPVVDILFKDLLADPIGCVQRIYRAAGDTLSADAEARMRDWGALNRQHKHGRHEYDPEDVGLTSAALRDRFQFYRRRFEESS